MRRSLRDLIGWLTVSALFAAALLPFGYPLDSLAAILGVIVSAKVVDLLTDLLDLPPETTSAYLGAMLLAVALWIVYAGVSSGYSAVVGALAAGWILNDAVDSYRRAKADECDAAAL